MIDEDVYFYCRWGSKFGNKEEKILPNRVNSNLAHEIKKIISCYKIDKLETLGKKIDEKLNLFHREMYFELPFLKEDSYPSFRGKIFTDDLFNEYLDCFKDGVVKLSKLEADKNLDCTGQNLMIWQGLGDGWGLYHPYFEEDRIRKRRTHTILAKEMEQWYTIINIIGGYNPYEENNSFCFNKKWFLENHSKAEFRKIKE